MKIVWKIVEGIIVIILLGLIFVNACFAYTKLIKKDKLANVLGYTYMVVQSNSMIPEFKSKDMLIIKLTDEFKVGDIVTFEEEDFFITHRVIEIKGNTLTTKGDNNNAADQPITRDRVIGVVKKIIK